MIFGNLNCIDSSTNELNAGPMDQLNAVPAINLFNSLIKRNNFSRCCRRLRRQFDEHIQRNNFLCPFRRMAYPISFLLIDSTRVCLCASCAFCWACRIIVHFFRGIRLVRFYWFSGSSVSVCVCMQKLNRCVAGVFIYLLLVYLVCCGFECVRFLWSMRSFCGRRVYIPFVRTFLYFKTRTMNRSR